jgi:nucleoside-diphosphate-sugar epimerase
MSSSPSTRFDGKDISGLRESDLKIQEPGQFLQPYAETKAMGEKALRAACCDELMTVAIAPHQVYGPRDALFLPNLLHAAKTGKLRIFGRGENDVSFTHVDNYCHALILGHDALHKGSPALGKFYIATDGGSQKFWAVIDNAVVAMGYPSLTGKLHLPVALLMLAAYICNAIGYLTGKKLKLSPFTVKMLVIDRWFNIDAARTDLKYEPLISFQEGWKQTVEWFVENKEWWVAKVQKKPTMPKKES